MKVNKVERRKGRRNILAIAAVAIIAAVAVCATLAYGELNRMWIEQSVITNVTAQVTINDGAMVKGAAILDAFGIRNGANLALIDMDAKRREILEKLPCVKSISVTMRQPDRAVIEVVERRAIVKLATHGKPGVTGRVADEEGMVFTCRRGTGMLPTIRERESEVTAVGTRLRGRALAALRLLESAGDPEYSALGILDADVSKSDYITATLGNYSEAHIAWEGMDDPNEANRPEMLKRLKNLRSAYTSGVQPDTKVWNATEPNRVYADSKKPIQ